MKEGCIDKLLLSFFEGLGQVRETGASKSKHIGTQTKNLISLQSADLYAYPHYCVSLSLPSRWS